MSSPWGKETQNAIDNFKISNFKFHELFYKALIEIKRAYAKKNYEIISENRLKYKKIIHTCEELINNFDIKLFPIDIMQTGSGTSSNMNVNEVIAKKASNKDIRIHPNDDVNRYQSSNSIIPSAINISNKVLLLEMIRNLEHFNKTLNTIIKNNKNKFKLGRTHLQDAVPMRISQEFSAYHSYILGSIIRLKQITKQLSYLPVNGTVIGTGISSKKPFGSFVCNELTSRFKTEFMESKNNFEGISLRGEQVTLMNELSALSSFFMKMANDLRLLSSGPNAGFDDIRFKKLQAGSSIMAGKVNPVIMESMIQVCALIIGRSLATNIANQNGPLQLNMMMPLISFLSNDSLSMMTNAIKTFDELGLKKIEFNYKKMEEDIYKSNSIITILKNNPKIGYDLSLQLVDEAQKHKIPILKLLLNKKIFTEKEIKKIFFIKDLVDYEK